MANCNVLDWKAGTALYKYYIERLWTETHKSFKAFVLETFGMSTNHAYRLMVVACNFTEDQVKEYGVTKLRPIARLPKADRVAVLEFAKTASVREVRMLVIKILGVWNSGKFGSHPVSFFEIPQTIRKPMKVTKVVIKRGRGRPRKPRTPVIEFDCGLLLGSLRRSPIAIAPY